MDCDQCGKPAIVNVNKHPLCVGCYALLQQTETARMEATNDHLRLLSAQQNHLLGQMEMATGIPLKLGRIQIPSRTAQQQNTFHNVKVEGGTVGAISTGTAQSIAVAIGTTEKHGNADLSEALKTFINELTDSHIGDEQKHEIAEQLGVLSEELAKPKEVRRRTVIAPMLDGLSKAVTVSHGLLELWTKLHPLLVHALQ